MGEQQCPGNIAGCIGSREIERSGINEGRRELNALNNDVHLKMWSKGYNFKTVKISLLVRLIFSLFTRQEPSYLLYDVETYGEVIARHILNRERE